MVVIRKIRAAEGERLRAIRLQAIADSPSAFGSTLADTEAVSIVDWEARASVNAAGEAAIMYVAEDEGSWVGLAGGVFDPEASAKIVIVFSMWVNPTHRRQHIGRELVQRVIAWARVRHAERIELWVTKDNEPAEALYADCGFTLAHEMKPLPSDPALLEQRMVQNLS
jgi:GNAT superfamily N-acetyltransferase